MLNTFKALELLQQDINIRDISELQLQELKIILKQILPSALLESLARAEPLLINLLAWFG